MGVREQHYVDFGRVEEEIPVLFERFLSFALEQAAIEKDVFAVDCNYVSRAGNFAGSPVKSKFHYMPLNKIGLV